MQFSITKEDFDKLSDDFKAEYNEGDDGSYTLKVEGGEDTGALKRAKDHEKKRRQQAEQKLREVEDEKNSLQEDYDDLKASKGGEKASEQEIANLNKKWQKKLDEQKESSDKTVSGLKGHLEKNLVDNVAASMAAEMSVSPSVLKPHIKSRLAAVEEDGKYVTKVLDADGDVGVMTLDELKTEFRNNKDFAPILKGSEASGSGAGDEGKGGKGGGNSDKSEDLSKLSPKELAAHLKSKKGE